jgi:hypothetical protein
LKDTKAVSSSTVTPGQLEAAVPPAQALNTKLARRSGRKTRKKDLGFINFLWYGIIPTRMKGIATDDAPYSHEAAFDHAVTVYGLITIMGTGRIKPAGILGERFRKSCLVKANQSQQQEAWKIPESQR